MLYVHYIRGYIIIMLLIIVYASHHLILYAVNTAISGLELSVLLKHATIDFRQFHILYVNLANDMVSLRETRDVFLETNVRSSS